MISISIEFYFEFYWNGMKGSGVVKMYMFGVVGETHAHEYFEVISFYNSKDI